MKVNLVMFKRDGNFRMFSLPDTVSVIGRRRDCELCLPLMVVSKRHCEFDQDMNKLTLRDLGSRNGTFVNGQKITQIELSPGDKVTIGPVKFLVQIDGKPDINEISQIGEKEHDISFDTTDLSESQSLDATTNGA